MEHRAKLNYAAIVVGGVVYWLVQAAWYTVFGKLWVVAIGKSMAEMQKGGSAIPFVGALICDIIVVCVLAWILARLGEPSASKGALMGAVLALGIIAATLMTNYLFEQRPVSLFLINSGAPLIGITLAGLIVGAWKVKSPKVVTAVA